MTDKELLAAFVARCFGKCPAFCRCRTLATRFYVHPKTAKKTFFCDKHGLPGDVEYREVSDSALIRGVTSVLES